MLSSLPCGLWISLILLSVTNGLPHTLRIEAEPTGLRIQPIHYGNVQHKPLWVDTSAFKETGIEEQDCSSNENEFCLNWGDISQFKITKVSYHCQVHTMWTSLDNPLSVTLNLEGAHLYGGTEMNNQSWPAENSPFNDSFTTHNVNSRAVLEPYWLTSTGQYIYVDPRVPLFVSQNKTALKLTAMLREPYIRKLPLIFFEYRFCSFKNVKAAHQDAITNIFGRPARVPDFRMIQQPIWSTWAVYKTNISEKKVYEYADAILRYNFSYSALEIDDMWETCYGSFIIDTKRFPDMKGLVHKLKTRDFRVTLWVHPFINLDCEPTLTEAKNLGYLVKNKDGSINTTWWNGEAATIDFTHQGAAKWWADRLRKIQRETGIDSFKFDAGETSWLPQVPVYAIMDDTHPDTIVKAYIGTASLFGDMVEVRTAKGTQAISPFVRMIDRETKWTGELSMHTLIPTLLQMNIVGYPFVLPDMIGGNAYNGDVLTEEMYIRWLQISVFMPALQFSLPPWNFSQQTIEITKKFIDLHAKYAEKIYKLMIKAIADGTPVNRPLWWFAPNDPQTYQIDCEFMLGDDLLVAPIVHEGATSRNIYLPKGVWRDGNNPNAPLIKGPIRLKNYEAGLDVLPYFIFISACPQELKI